MPRMEKKNNDTEFIINQTRELIDLRSKILSYGDILDTEFFKKAIPQFYLGIRKLQELFIDIPALTLDDSYFENDEHVVEFLQKVLNNEPFEELEKKKSLVAYFFLINNSSISKEKIQPDNFTDFLKKAIHSADSELLNQMSDIMDLHKTYDFERDNDLAEEHYFPWHSQYDYIQGMRDASSIIVKAGKLPEHFERVFQTIKKCYAFQQYLAVTTLCRTAIEIAIRDIYFREGFSRKGSPEHGLAKTYFFNKRANKSKTYPREYDPWFSDMKELLCKLPEFEDFKDDINELYSTLSSIIHGNSVPAKQKSDQLMKDTIWLIHDLYAVEKE